MFIYLVRSGGLLSPDAAPLAAFTNREQMRVWLSERDPANLVKLKVFRMEDGGVGAVVEISIDDILNEEGQ